MGDALTPTKICTRCGEEKPATREFFYRDRGQRAGLSSQCKRCVSNTERTRRVRNAKAIAAKRKAYNQAHAEQIKAYGREYRQRNREANRLRMRAYRKAKPEIVAKHERARKNVTERRGQQKRYYSENRDRLRAQQAEYRAANRERLLAARRAKREIEKHDPKFKVAKAISGSLLQALRHKKNGSMWETLVGYDREQLVQHIERQFRRGMSWANFGTKWHIDHIRPVSSFAFASADDPEVTACWALTNLRPLWKLDNLSKHARRTHLI